MSNNNFNWFGEVFTNTTALNHGIHSYPAKFPPQVPKKILEDFSHENYVILDPFCGSGTTLVEASLMDLNSLGNDINPIATLISTVKTTYYSDKDIALAKEIVTEIRNEYSSYIAENKKIEETIKFQGKDHWFQSNVQSELELILSIINSCQDVKIKKLLQVILSEILISVSNQESDTRYAAKNKNIQDGFTVNSFCDKSSEIFGKIKKYSDKRGNNKYNSTILSEDARSMKSIKENSIDLIITSPPYANTYDYYLYHKHRMNWLGFNFKIVQKQEIGSRHEYSSKKMPVDQWEQDLLFVLEEMYRVLKNDRYAFLIIGDSVIKKKLIKIDDIIAKIAPQVGFKVIHVESTLLSNNSKRFNKNFRSKEEKKEHLIQLYKS